MPVSPRRGWRAGHAINFPALLASVAHQQGVGVADIEVWFEDEARIGRKNKITPRWARCGSRPSAPSDQRTASTYIFGAICPAQGKAVGLARPWCNTDPSMPFYTRGRGRMILHIPMRQTRIDGETDAATPSAYGLRSRRAATAGMNVPAFDTASANFSISGTRVPQGRARQMASAFPPHAISVASAPTSEPCFRRPTRSDTCLTHEPRAATAEPSGSK